METKLRDLLDKIYELEGLVHLALKRDDSSADFLRLISKKGAEIGEICNNLKAEPLEEAKLKEPEEKKDLSAFSLEEYTIDEEPNKNDSSYYLEDESDFVSEQIDKRPSEFIDKQPHTRGKLVFSINERFRFRKELFDNSDVDFNTTLALVASMENYDEAEDYFINEEGFDPSNPVVKEFMDVIKRYFK